MTTREHSEQLASYALGLLDDEARTEVEELVARDSVAKEELQQLERTLCAVNRWRNDVSNAPVVARRLPRRRELVLWPLATAAIILLALGLTVHSLLNHTVSASLKADLAWTEEDIGRPGEFNVHYEHARTNARQQPAHETRVCRNGAQGLLPRARVLQMLAESIPGVRVPEKLLGDLQFCVAESPSRGRARLVYTNETDSLDVFLALSAGSDTSVQRLRVDGRELVAARRHGVVAAFDGSLHRGNWKPLVNALLGGAHDEGNGDS